MNVQDPSFYTRLHLKAGWVALSIFLALGILLETLHGLKLPYYLDMNNSARRLMWTLAHSHGTLFAAINILFAFTIPYMSEKANIRWISRFLILGMVGMPLGFFLGGLWLQQEEPGLGVFLVPIFALILLAGVALILPSLPSIRDETTTQKPGRAQSKSKK